MQLCLILFSHRHRETWKPMTASQGKSVNLQPSSSVYSLLTNRILNQLISACRLNWFTLILQLVMKCTLFVGKFINYDIRETFRWHGEMSPRVPMHLLTGCQVYWVKDMFGLGFDWKFLFSFQWQETLSERCRKWKLAILLTYSHWQFNLIKLDFTTYTLILLFHRMPNETRAKQIILFLEARQQLLFIYLNCWPE